MRVWTSIPICIYVHIYIYIYIEHIHAHIQIHIHLHIHRHMHIHMNRLLSISTYSFLHFYIQAHTSTYAWVTFCGVFSEVCWGPEKHQQRYEKQRKAHRSAVVFSWVRNVFPERGCFCNWEPCFPMEFAFLWAVGPYDSLSSEAWRDRRGQAAPGLANPRVA